MFVLERRDTFLDVFVPFLYRIRILISLATKTSIPAYVEDPFPGSASDKTKEMFNMIHLLSFSKTKFFFCCKFFFLYIGYALQSNEPNGYVKTRVASYELLVTSLKLKSTS